MNEPARVTTASEPILHVDMDAFFASVEQRDDPSLRGKPVVVGGAGGRGVVAAASYEARQYGIHSAMPMVQARRQCPDLIVVSHRGHAYKAASALVMQVLHDVTPLVEPLSSDEAFLDVSGAVRLFGAPVQIGHMIRRQVKEAVSLPCSVGVGPTKSVAKLLSGKAKPNGLVHWRAEDVADNLRPLPVADLWGAGPKTVERLHQFGYRYVGQIADEDPATLKRLVGDKLGWQLQALARGVDERTVRPRGEAKSVSAEQTFDTDITDLELARRSVLALSQKVARRLRKAALAGRTVTLKVRFAPFETITRSATLPAPTDTTHQLIEVVSALLQAAWLPGRGVRLLGVGVSNFADGGGQQLSLDAALSPEAADATDVALSRWGELDRIADSVAQRFTGVDLSSAASLPARPTVNVDRPPDDDRPG